ncbi:hypothetical protein KKI22_01885 [Patescibacteria group bacterium]|nr:hypothetical protein [Patescibacteria group bacterium]
MKNDFITKTSDSLNKSYSKTAETKNLGKTSSELFPNLVNIPPIPDEKNIEKQENRNDEKNTSYNFFSYL